MTKELDFDAIKAAAESHRADMTRFLRAMISHPSESCEEGEVVACIKAEMESLGYDEVKVDGLGNVMGFMGEGDKIIAIDSHIDTVGIGNIENWDADPYEGYETDEIIYGRGGSDQEGGMASATYAAKMMKDMGLIPEGYKIMVVGSVQEEDCDGMCWQYIYNKDGIKPEFVISTEPTDGGIYRGHRGRMEIRVDVHGTSCHGSAPERGDNAIYKMADILQNIHDTRLSGTGHPRYNHHMHTFLFLHSFTSLSDRRVSQNHRFQFQLVAGLFLNRLLDIIAQLQHIVAGGLSGIHHKAGVFLADLCISHARTFQAALVDEERRIISNRTAECASGAGQFQRLFGTPFSQQVIHLFLDLAVLALRELKRHSGNDAMAVLKDAGSIAKLHFLFDTVESVPFSSMHSAEMMMSDISLP